MLDRLINWFLNRRPADHVSHLGMLWVILATRYVGVGVSLLTDTPEGGYTNVHPESGVTLVLRGAVVRHLRGEHKKRSEQDYVYTDDEGSWLSWTQKAGDSYWWIKGDPHKWELQAPQKYEERILDLAWMNPRDVRTDTQRQAVVLTILFSKEGKLP